MIKDKACFLIAWLLNTLGNGWSFKIEMLAQYYLLYFHFVKKKNRVTQENKELFVRK